MVTGLDGRPPASAAWLGGLGAIPFVGLSAAVLFLSGPVRVAAVQALLAYGAVILSFLGGVHWGLAMAGTDGADRDRLWLRLIVSVTPSLAAWAALLVGGRAGLFVLAASVAAMLWVDLRATRLAQAPRWYPALRIPLTVVVVTALLVAAFAG